MGSWTLSQVAVGATEFRTEGATCKQGRITKETSRETRDEGPADLGRWPTWFWFLGGPAVCTLSTEPWESPGAVILNCKCAEESSGQSFRLLVKQVGMA